MSAEERDAAAAAAAAKRGMSSLEMEPTCHGDVDVDAENGNENEEEMESLVSGSTGRLGRVKSRKTDKSFIRNGRSGGLFAALAERNTNFSYRSLLLIGCLAGIVFYFVEDINRIVFSSPGGGGGKRESDAKPTPPPGGSFHQSSFGGLNNLGHPAGARAYTQGEFRYEEIFVPVSNVGHAVSSLSPENVLNYVGHYVHDEHRSPYASHLYKRNLTELDDEQRRYEAKMAGVRTKWGAWNFRDDYPEKHGVKSRPVADFAPVKYRDLPVASFPDGAWQTDVEYVKQFLTEAKALVTRVKEGIYAEYGQPTVNADGTNLSPGEVASRDKLFSVAHEQGEDRTGKLGFLEPNAWDALVRKLLHAMMTNDEFYVVLGGHSAAAGHGNNFLQSKAMAFHYLMEPIFDKLGMRLVSRNMAQGGVGTTHSAMASGSIYGEKDILFWDSSMTEKAAGALDLFNKQAILGGERVPILMNSPRVNIVADSNGTAWLGNIETSQWEPGGIVPFTTESEEHAQTLPFAVRYMFCPRESAGLCQMNKYTAICWEPRSDFTPTKPQAAHPGSQVSWHPGNRYHQMAARMYSMLVLHALDAAIDKWQSAVDSDNFPLGEEHWHVGEIYKEAQDALRTTISTAENGSSACEKMLPRFPRACRVAMRGFGEWTPRRNPSESSLISILKPAPNGYLPYQSIASEFAGINVLPLIQRVPDGQVDVHAIAIASTAPAPHLDYSLADDEERRKLAKATHEAVRFRLQRARELHERRRRDLKEAERLSSSQTLRGRNLDGEDAIVPGRGWVGNTASVHFCDGSYASECGRNMGIDCLIGGHNDGRGSISGDSLSGWLVFNLPKVKEGLILLRIEWWNGGPQGNSLTSHWTEVNDGKTNEEEPKFVFPDLAPKVNATTPFAKLKAAKEAKTKKAEADAAAAASTATLSVPSTTDADTSEKSLGNGTDLSNVTRRVLFMRPSVRHALEETYPLEYPFEDVNDADWGSLTEHDFRRRMKSQPPPVPDDFQFDIAINGKIVKTMDRTEFMSYSGEIVKNWAIWTLMDDVEWAKSDWGDRDGEDVEAAIRFRGTRRSVTVSHIYYA